MKLWQAWVRLLSRKEPGTALALFRIATGLVVAYTLLRVMQTGLVDVVWVDEAYGGYRSLSGNWLVKLLGGPTPEVMWRLSVATLAGGLMMAAGLGGRVTNLVALQLFLATSDANGQAGGSYDELISNAMWLLVLASSTTTLSLDCRLTTGRWTSDTAVSAWPRYLAIYQLFLMYWTTGLQKLSAYWTPGGGFSALYYILQQPTWQRFDNSWAAYLYPVTQVGTAVTWFWEVGAPLLLLAFWWRYTADRPGRLRRWANKVDLRLIYAAIGASFHVLVMLPMNIGPFSFASLMFYSCLFTPDEYARAWRRLSPAPAASGTA